MGTIVRIRGIKRYRDPKTGRWYAYHRASNIRLKELPFAIGLTSGMREGDIIALRRDALRSGRINIPTAKRGVWIDVPVSREITEALAELPPHDAITLSVSSKGQTLD